MKKSLLPILLICVSLSALAQAPMNDEAAGATTATVYPYGSPAPFATSTTVNATSSTVPTPPSTPSSCGCPYTVPGGPLDVWVKFNTGTFTHFDLNLNAAPGFGTLGYVRIYSDISTAGVPILCRCSPTSSAPLAGFAFTGLATNTDYYIAFSAKVATSGFWGPFDYRIIGANSPLPIKLEYLNLKQTNEGNLIEWKIQYHESVESLNIERRNENDDAFKTIYSTNDINKNAQSFSDKDATLGKNKYRIASIDLDGNKTYSEIESISNKSRNILDVYPNPAVDNDELTMARKHYGDIAKVQIYNLNGSLLLEKKIMTPDQIITIKETANFNAGIYFVKYKSTDSDYPETIKWIKL